MNKIPKSSWVAFALAATTPWTCAYAQDSEELDDDEIFTLSPFQVDASQDSGYRAQSTTAGSRLNSQLKDVAASVTVLTEDFMDDLGATDIATALSMVAGVETDLTTDQSIRNLGQGFLGGDFTNPNASEGRIRIRGLGQATNAANYLEIFGPLDRFNMERTEFLRGPSALLFGLGQPGGVVNYTPKRGNLNEDINKVDVVLDNYGSRRLAVDVGRVLISDKLAVRFAGLTSEERYRVKTAEQDNTSLYLAAAFKPLKSTRIDAYFEDIEQSGRRPNYRLPQDNVSAWLDEYNKAQADAAGDGMVSTANGEIPLQQFLDDNLVWDGRWAVSSNGQAPRSPDIPFTERLLIDAEGNPLVRPGEFRRVMDVRPGGVTAFYDPEHGWDAPIDGQFTRLGARGIDGDEARGGNNRNTPWARTRFHRSSFGNDRVDSSFVDPQILDERIFPYLTQEIGTFPGNGRSVDSRKLGLNIEHKFTEGLFLNLSYLKESYTADQVFAPLAQSHAVSIDINRYLPSSLPNPLDFRGNNAQLAGSVNRTRTLGMTLEDAIEVAKEFVEAGVEAESNQRFVDAAENPVENPNYLRPFIHGRSIGRFTNVESEAFLVQLNYDYNFSEKDSLAFLGDHRLTAFMSGNENRRHTYNTTSAIRGVDGVLSREIANQPHPGLWYTPVWYIGDPVRPGDETIRRTALPAATFTGEGENLPFLGFDRREDGDLVTRGQWQTFSEPISWTRQVLTNSPRLSDIRNGGWGVSAQSFFWNRRIVTALGYRKDTTNNDLFTRVDYSGSFQDIPGDGSAISDYDLSSPLNLRRQTEALRTTSVVFHATDWLRFFYNESENFDLANPTIDGFFRPNPLPSGETEEYGLGMSLLEDKLDMKMTFYDTKQHNALLPSNIRLRSRLPNFERDVLAVFRTDDQAAWNGETTDFTIEDWLVQTGIDADGAPIFGASDPADRVQAVQNGNLRWTDAPANTIEEWNYDGFRILGSTSSGTTQDTYSEGWDFEATYNPNSKIRLSLNVSKLENTLNNIERQSLEYVQVRNQAVWEDLFRLGYHDNGDNDATRYFSTSGNNSTRNFDDLSLISEWNGEAFESVPLDDGFDVPTGNFRFGNPSSTTSLLISEFYRLAGRELLQNIENEGQPNQGVSKYNARLTANYTFREGRFKGMFVGTNLRWQSGQSLGSEQKVVTGEGLPEGFPNPDINGNGTIDPGEALVTIADRTKPLVGDSIVTGGLRIGYRTKLNQNKLNWRIQLNVDNVFKQGGNLRVIRLNPDRTPVYGINHPTTYKLTNSFEF